MYIIYLVVASVSELLPIAIGKTEIWLDLLSGCFAFGEILACHSEQKMDMADKGAWGLL